MNRMRRTCRNSRACPGVTPIQAALSNTVGEARLCDMGEGQWAYALENAVESAPASSTGNASPAVKTINIPWLLDTFHISEIDLLKLDIEGAECAVLDESARQWLARCKRVSIEPHDWLNRRSSRTIFRRFLEFPQFTCRAVGELLIFENRERIAAAS